MTRHVLLIPALLIGLTGCGGDEEATDPSKLPPITEKDRQEIEQRDQEIETEEESPLGAPPAGS